MSKNLIRKNFKLSSIYDINKSRTKGFPCTVAQNPKQVANDSDILITGGNSTNFSSKNDKCCCSYSCCGWVTLFLLENDLKMT